MVFILGLSLSQQLLAVSHGERILNLKRRIPANLHAILTRFQPHFITASGIIMRKGTMLWVGYLGGDAQREAVTLNKSIVIPVLGNKKGECI